MRAWLKNLRIEKNLSMKQMADKLGISESYYCSIENGYRQRNMDISLAAKISKIFSIPIKRVLQFEEEMKSQMSEQQELSKV